MEQTVLFKLHKPKFVFQAPRMKQTLLKSQLKLQYGFQAPRMEQTIGGLLWKI